MGCDYYIIKYLDVKYKDKHTNTEHTKIIELYRRGCYFSCSDSDDSDIFLDEENHPNLLVNYKPRILFNNGKWEKNKIQERYFNVINQKIDGDFEILNVVKKESRELRN